MEEAVWLWVGAVSVLLAFGIIASLVIKANNLREDTTLMNSLGLLQQQCNYVCGSYNGTRLSVSAEIPENTRISSRRNLICSQRESLTCVQCNCQLKEKDILNFTGDIAKELGSKRYSCSFLKENGLIEVDCYG